MLRSLIFCCLSPHHEPLYTYTSIHCGLMSGLHWLTNFCRFWSEVLPSAPECSGALESEFNADFTVLPSCMHLPPSCLSCTYAHACTSLSSIPADICYMLNETKSLWKSHKRLVETDSVSGEGGAFSNKTFPPRNTASGPFLSNLWFSIQFESINLSKLNRINLSIQKAVSRMANHKSGWRLFQTSKFSGHVAHNRPSRNTPREVRLS